MAISSYSTNANNNTATPPNGAPEGQAPSTVNNVIRQIMADIRSFYETPDYKDLGHTPTYSSATTFLIATDVTSYYTANRPIRCTDATTLYGYVVSSSYTAPNTTVTVAFSSGSLSASLSAVAVGLLDPTYAAIGAACIKFLQSGTGAVATDLQTRERLEIYATDFGAVANGDGIGGGTNSATFIQNAITAVQATGVKGIVKIPPGIYRCDTGLTIDLSLCTLEGYGATLDFTNLVPASGGALSALSTAGYIGAVAGCALTVICGGNNYAGGAYYELTNSVRGLRLKGKNGASEGGVPPAAPNDLVGIYFYGPVGQTAVIGKIESAVITQFYTGVVFGQNCWGEDFDHCQIGFNSTCIFKPQVNNAGENGNYNACVFFNSETGLKLQNTSADTHLNGCSIDGMSTSYINMTAGTLSVTNSHWEGDTTTARMFYNDGSVVGSYATVTISGMSVLPKTGRANAIFTLSQNTLLTIVGGLLNDASGVAGVPLISASLGSSVAIVGGYWSSSSNLFVASPAFDYIYSGIEGLGLNGATITNKNTTVGNLSSTGDILASGTTGVGYTTGAGGAVTQLTSKSTGVTINKPCGQITMNNAALASGASVQFQVTNSVIVTTDTIIIQLNGSGLSTAGTYDVTIFNISAGSFWVNLKNISAGSLSEALGLNFSVLKAIAA